MKFLIASCILLVAHLSQAQTLQPSSSELFKSKVETFKMKLPTSKLSQSLLPFSQFKLDSKGIMITYMEAIGSVQPGSIPCVKPELLDQMPCANPSFSSLMPIIKPANNGLALIQDVE